MTTERIESPAKTAERMALAGKNAGEIRRALVAQHGLSGDLALIAGLAWQKWAEEQ